MHAVRTLSPRLPVLSPAEAIEYVSALLDGDAPKRIVAVATKELVEPLNPVFAVESSPRCSPPERLPVGRQPKPGRLTVALLETGSLGVKSEAGQCGCASGCACC
jgi:hypothetical protein